MAAILCAANVAVIVLSAKISTKFAADIRAEIFHKAQGFFAAETDRFGVASLAASSASDGAQ